VILESQAMTLIVLDLEAADLHHPILPVLQIVIHQAEFIQQPVYQITDHGPTVWMILFWTSISHRGMKIKLKAFLFKEECFRQISI
jgi:hypothetical protein